MGDVANATPEHIHTLELTAFRVFTFSTFIRRMLEDNWETSHGFLEASRVRLKSLTFAVSAQICFAHLCIWLVPRSNKTSIALI